MSHQSNNSWKIIDEISIKFAFEIASFTYLVFVSQMEPNTNKWHDGTLGQGRASKFALTTGNDIIWTGNGSLQLMENE